MTYKNWIEELRKEFVGKKVVWEGETYTIAMVDYNAVIHINKPSKYNDTTAVYEPWQAKKALV